jgi:hypothetical protein
MHQVQTLVSQQTRLHNVAFRVTSANRADCRPNVAPRLGVQFATPADFPSNLREAAIEALQLDADRPTITAFADTSPAARSGIMPRDVLVAIDGEPAPSANVDTWMSDQLAKSGGTRAVRVDVIRQGQPKTFSVVPAAVCSVPVLLSTDNSPNALTDGKRIVIFNGIMRLTQSDAELAIVVGHELAHVTMAHLQKQAQNRALGAVGGAVADVGLALLGVNTGGAFTRAGGNAGAMAFSQDFEKEADYVGAYYAARAGYEVGGTESFWRSMANERPGSMYYAGSHPTTPERFVQMQKTVAEIADKKKRRVALTPEIKPTATASAEAPVTTGYGNPQ